MARRKKGPQMYMKKQRRKQQRKKRKPNRLTRAVRDGQTFAKRCKLRTILGLGGGHMLYNNPHVNATHVKHYEEVIFLATDANGHFSIQVSSDPLVGRRTATTIVGPDVTGWSSWSTVIGAQTENELADVVRVLGMSVTLVRVAKDPQGYVAAIQYPGWDGNSEAARASTSTNDRGGTQFTINTLVEGHSTHCWVVDAGVNAGVWADVPDTDAYGAGVLGDQVYAANHQKAVNQQLNDLTIHGRDLQASASIMLIVRRAVQYAVGEIQSGATTSLKREPDVGAAHFTDAHHESVVSLRDKVGQTLFGHNPKGIFEKVGGRVLGFAHKAIDIGAQVVNGASLARRLTTASSASRALAPIADSTPIIQDLDTGETLAGALDFSTEASALPLLLA